MRRVGWRLIVIGCCIGLGWSLMTYDNHQHWEGGPESLAKARATARSDDSVQPLSYRPGIIAGGAITGLGIIILAIRRP
jgi:hypothetical protein